MLAVRLLKKLLLNLFYSPITIPKLLFDCAKYLLFGFICSATQFPVYWKWVMYDNSPQWKLKGSYPSKWMILSLVMLHPFFVGIVCGSVFNNILPSNITIELLDIQQAWFPTPNRESLDIYAPTTTAAAPNPSTKVPKAEYCINTAKTTYSVSRRNVATIKRGALVDRGANGGLAGSDAQTLHTTDRRVDVQGIDNHQVTDIPIVTSAGVVDTQRGPIVLIMNQYARVQKGHTVHSSAQLEAHGVTVDDCAIPNGGHQRIITHGGYVIPLQVRSGLVYMDMRPPTDKELSEEEDGGLPQIVLTADQDWVPSSIDYEHDAEEWFDAMENLPDLEYNLPFDEFGNYSNTHELEALCTQIEAKYDLSSVLLMNEHDIITAQEKERQQEPSRIDFQALQPKFGWLPVDVIRPTFDKTTQFYCTPASPTLKKRFKSPYPACNVERRQEPIATDTVYSDTPAINGGCRVAQVFVGTESGVIDVYGMKTEKQFVNTLQDVIRTRGAPTKLISDSAQVEISNKIKDILRHLFIQDW